MSVMFDCNSMNDSDLARLLQEEYDCEAASILEESASNTNVNTPASFNNSQKYVQSDNHIFGASSTSLMSALSPVDPSLELSDPTPDISLLFLQFNAQFFWGTLAGIEVKWSPRMTMCAGLCVYEGRGGLCSVRLSLPLLKLRPRKDLVETLLHEMIHAFLFVSHNDRDHSDHGPNFLSHMHRINKATGAKISVYHTFFDEVASYQQHWWRCNGPCQQRAPYYGYVKRSMNRAPSPTDLWWADHQATCGGVYTKIKEPEGYGQKKTGKGKGKEGKPADPSKDIRTFWGQGHTLGSSSDAAKKPDGKSHATERTNISSLYTTVKPSGSGLSNRSDGKTSVNETESNTKSPYGPRLFNTVTKSTTGQAINPSASGRTGTSTSTTLKQVAPTSYTDKHLTHTNNTRSPPKAFLNGTNKVSNTRQEMPGNNMSWQVTRGSSDDGEDLIDLTSGDISGSSPKTTVLDIRSGSKLNKILGETSSSTKNKWKNSPDVRNTKVSFPKNFVSVCEGDNISKPTFSSKKKKKRYIIDELDSNEGLWEETGDANAGVSFRDSSGSINSREKANAVTSVSHVDKLAERPSRPSVRSNDHGGNDASLTRNEPEKSTRDKPSKQLEGLKCPTESDLKRREVESSKWCFKNKTSDFQTTLNEATWPGLNGLGSQSSVSEGEMERFTGQGHKLGTGEGGTSYLSQIRKIWQQRYSDAANPKRGESSHGLSDNKHSRLSQINKTTGVSTMSGKKRKSVQAFGESDSSDSDSSKVVGADKGERSSRAAAPSISGNELSDVSQRLVSEQPDEANNSGRTNSDDKVPCPVCTVMVSIDRINTHLDICLISG